MGFGQWVAETMLAAFTTRARRPPDITIGSQPLDEAATYRIVVPDHLAGGAMNTPFAPRPRVTAWAP